LFANIAIIIGILLLWLNNAFSEAGFWVLLILGLFILACWNIVKFWKRNNNQALHPINITLSKFGPPEKIANVINEELKTPKVEVKPVIITSSWLIKPSFFGLEMILLAELAWVYSKVTTNYTNGIRTGESYSVAIHKRDGKLIEISCGKLASSLLIARVTEVAPWAVGGFSEDIKKLWGSDRAGFIAHIDQRRREINARSRSA